MAVDKSEDTANANVQVYMTIWQGFNIKLN